MRRWRHPTSRDLWVAAHPAPNKPRGCCSRSHPIWAFFKSPTRCETSQATTQIISCYGLGLRPQFPPPKDLLASDFNQTSCRAPHRQGLQELRGPADLRLQTPAAAKSLHPRLLGAVKQGGLQASRSLAYSHQTGKSMSL